MKLLLLRLLWLSSYRESFRKLVITWQGFPHTGATRSFLPVSQTRLHRQQYSKKAT